MGFCHGNIENLMHIYPTKWLFIFLTTFKVNTIHPIVHSGFVFVLRGANMYVQVIRFTMRLFTLAQIELVHRDLIIVLQGVPALSDILLVFTCCLRCYHMYLIVWFYLLSKAE